MELTFAAPPPAVRISDTHQNYVRPPASSLVDVGINPATDLFDSYFDPVSSLSNLGSLPVTTDVVVPLRLSSDGYPQDLPKSPTPTWEPSQGGQPDPAPGSSNTHSSREGNRTGAVEFENTPQKHPTSPSKMRADTLDSLDEADASAAPPSKDKGKEEVTFSEKDTDTIHRFLGRVVQPSGAGLGTTAPDLARQLHETITEHADTLARDRLTRSAVDPENS